MFSFLVEGYGQFSLVDSLSVKYKIRANFRDEALEESLLEDPLYSVSGNQMDFLIVHNTRKDPVYLLPSN